MPRFQIFAFVSAALVAATPAVAQILPVCKPVLDAEIKVATTPHHAVSTQTGSATPGETITVDGANYVKLRGTWRKSPMTPQENVEREQQNIKDAKVYSCTVLPADSVDGAPAVVYKVHSETPDVGSADATIWLSKATGLPLRTEEDIDTGQKQHVSIKYDYANIKAPVVK
jgi:hypothetical protein